MVQAEMLAVNEPTEGRSEIRVRYEVNVESHPVDGHVGVGHVTRGLRFRFQTLFGKPSNNRRPLAAE